MKGLLEGDTVELDNGSIKVVRNVAVVQIDNVEQVAHGSWEGEPLVKE
jgi:hypothetical protein